MNLLNTKRLYSVANATWPAMSVQQYEGWDIRDGAGAGKRASAATLALDGWTDIAPAEQAMQALGQEMLFMIREGETELDMRLEVRGYKIIDPVIIYACKNSLLAPKLLPVAQSYAIWEPLQVMREIWAMGGINAERIALMHRVKAPKTGLLARSADTPAGTAFVALNGDIAMIHAVEVLQSFRRTGVARKLMAQAAKWAQDNGATYMSLMTTAKNVAANELYQSMGMKPVGHYHYRKKEST